MKKLTGQIVSNKMENTMVVAITEIHRHRLYHKSYKVTHKILAHTEKEKYKIGDKVEIVSVRPISRNKAWEITRKIE